jgi:hypothetical protein
VPERNIQKNLLEAVSRQLLKLGDEGNAYGLRDDGNGNEGNNGGNNENIKFAKLFSRRGRALIPMQLNKNNPGGHKGKESMIGQFRNP